MARTKESSIVPKLPAKDISWVHCTDNNGCEWVITSRPDRSLYFLYKFVPGGYELTMKGQSPMDFYDVVYPPEPEPTPKKKRATKGG